MLTIVTRIQGFTSKLHEITHSQWISHNITRHHRTNDTICLDTKEGVMQESERQLDIGFDNLSKHSKYLLEIDPNDLYI